ncbi:hypothetical protein GT025_33815 [Streptomyces sp. SID4920]|nr:hypothetical protein [Streptomyces sp. SID4920]MYX63942.1 hypothetical protein [Streptomyces sp. SID8373]
MPLMLTCGVGFFSAAVVVTADAYLLLKQPLVTVIWLSSALAGCALGGLLCHLLDRRRRLTPRAIWVTIGVMIALVWGASTASSHVFMSSWDRFERELGGAGQCLAGTPYGSGNASLVTNGPKNGSDVMEVWPGSSLPKGRKLPPLKLKNAVDGGVHPLAPADGTSRDMLRSYGCR